MKATTRSTDVAQQLFTATYFRRALAAWFVLLMVSLPAFAGGETELRGAELLKPFKQQLMGALKQGMQGGPLAAIPACQLQAPAIAQSLSVDGVRIGRTSHRLRNPANASPSWVLPVMDEWLEEGAVRSPRSVTLEKDRLGYVEPIGIKPLCLACHGANIAPDVASQIETLY